MRRILLLLTAIICCALPALAQPSQGDNWQQQAQENLDKKDYTRARHFFLQAYNAHAADGQCDKAVACGVQATALYHRENYYKEAFNLLWSVEQTIMNYERTSGKPQPALRYPVTRERLQMYIKLRKSTSAKEQLARLEGWAKAAATDSIDTDLLYRQANYYYAFGQASQGDEALGRLIASYTNQKDYAKAEACYREMLSAGRRSGNAAMVARVYDRFMAWNDSIQTLAAQERYDELNARYEESLQTIAEKDDALSTRHYTIAALGILALVLAILLGLGAVVLLRFTTRNRKLVKNLQAADKRNALKAQFIRHISTRAAPALDTLDASLPAVKALKAFFAHIEILSSLEDSLAEPYETEDTNMATFCESVAEKIRGKLQAGVSLTVNAPRLSVRINREHVEKVLLHLLANAALYTPADGKIWLDFKKRGAHLLQFTVTDTGCGIPEDRRESLFRPFSAATDLTQGDGLGLPICALEAGKMNGTLSLDETYTKGARFVLDLHA